MAFYPQFPAIYAYPMPFPANQEFYGMYPPGSAPAGPMSHAPHHAHPMAMSEPAHQGMYYGEGPAHHAGMGGHHHHHGGHGGRHFYGHGNKHGYNNRKESMDSGISDFSMASSSGRKTSNTSTISNSSIILEEPSQEKPGQEEAVEAKEEKEEAPMEIPDDDLCEKIVEQVEFYFSDANITKDKFLLKHVKRNKEGFVSLKLISSFKRVKHLTKDWRQVANAIERKSEKLEVNDLKTKVRRLEALPEYDETTPSRTVVALDLPLARPTIEGVAELFASCGDIVLIRILRPGNPIPADIKPFVNKHPEMTAKVCALVEFEKTEFALKAVRELNNKDDEETSETEEEKATEEGEEKEKEAKEPKMKVMELTAPPAKSTKAKEEKKKAATLPKQAPTMPTRRFSHAGFNLPAAHQETHAKAEQLMASGPRRRISLYHNMKFAPISEEQQKKEMSLNPNAPSFSMASHGHAHSHAHPVHQRRLSRPPFVHPAHAMEMAAMNAAMNAMQTQFYAQAHHHAAAAHAHGAPWGLGGRRVSHHEHFGAMPMPNVARAPRAPERGRGFQKWCRSRMEPAQPAAPLPKKSSRAVPIVAPPAPSLPPQAAPQEVPQAEAAPAAVAVEAVNEVVEGAAALAIGDAQVPISDSGDSGNEEDAFSDHEPENLENERSR